MSWDIERRLITLESEYERRAAKEKEAAGCFGSTTTMLLALFIAAPLLCFWSKAYVIVELHGFQRAFVWAFLDGTEAPEPENYVELPEDER